MKKFDYTGKDIFVGIDVHKKNYAVAVIFDTDKAWYYESLSGYISALPAQTFFRSED